MPHVSSIFPKFVSAVEIVMPPSNNNRNAHFFGITKCCLPSCYSWTLTNSMIPGYSYSLINSLFCSQYKLLNIFAIITYTESIFKPWKNSGKHEELFKNYRLFKRPQPKKSNQSRFSQRARVLPTSQQFCKSTRHMPEFSC